MRPRLAVLAAALLGAGCLPVQQGVPLGPGFYPSAIAYDPATDTRLVASFASGAVVAIDRAGRPAATLRPGGAEGRQVQIAFDPTRRVLWTLLPEAIELREPGRDRVRRIALPDPVGEGDLALDGDAAYVLDAARGQILRIDAPAATSRLLATLPVTAAHARGDDAPGPPGADGAIARLPGGEAVLVALGGRMWRVSTADGARTELELPHPLAQVSQLVVLAAAGDEARVAALRGYRNEIVGLRVPAAGVRVEIDDRDRVGADTPLRAAFDGRTLHVLLSPVRHHPALGGDGRPNVFGRILAVAPGAFAGAPVRVARRAAD